MSLTLGRQGGIAQPLKKRTVGQTNIAHIYDGTNHIWPTSVIHFSDFTSVQLRYIWGGDDGRDTDNYKFRFGFVAGNSEFRGQQTIQCYVGTQGGKADDGKTSIGEIKYTKLNKIGELTIYSPIES